MKYLVIGLLPFALFACKSTQSTSQEDFTHLNVAQGELSEQKWQGLNRFPPLYPIEEARAGKEGCATIEYVVTPDYQIKDVKVVTSTSKYFAKEAKKNVERWKWSTLPQGILQQAMKTQTRYEFCLEEGDGHCSEVNVVANSQCSGTDVIASVGFKMKH